MNQSAIVIHLRGIGFKTTQQIYMIKNYLIVAAAIVGIGVGSVGTLYISKAIRPEIKLSCPPAPPCNCPPAVSLQNFDLEKLNNRKGTFTYSPQLNNVRVVIEAKDSTLLKQILRGAR